MSSSLVWLFYQDHKEVWYSQCQFDHTLFVHIVGRRTIIINVYVDDIILTRDHEEEIGKLKSFVAREFEIKDLGNLKYFLRMEIVRSKMGIAIFQWKYVLDLLKKTRMFGCKPANTPIDYSTKLEIVKGSALVYKGRYQRLVGKLIYLSHIRLDIAFSINMVSQFMNDPIEEHMKVVYRILRYLKMTPRRHSISKERRIETLKFFQLQIRLAP